MIREPLIQIELSAILRPAIFSHHTARPPPGSERDKEFGGRGGETERVQTMLRNFHNLSVPFAVGTNRGRAF